MVVVFALVFVMAASLLYGCAPKTEPTPSAAPTSAAPATSAAPETSAAPVSPTAAGEIPLGDLTRIQALPNQVPWTGVIYPNEASRADINKAIKADNTKDKVKVGYVTWTNGTPFFAAQTDTIKKMCEEYGWEFTMAVSDADNAKQVAAIENMVTLGVDIIIDVDWSVEAEAAAIKAAADAGIPTIGLGLPFPSEVPVITTMATDFYGQGFMVGQLLAQQFTGVAGAKIATSCGMIGHPIAEGKLNGFIGGFVYQRAIDLGKPFATKVDAMLYGYELEQQIVKNAKFEDSAYDWSVVVNIDGAWSQDGGQKAMEDILTGHPDVMGVFTDNDQEAFGAIKAIQAAGMKPGTDIKLVCVGDGTRDALQMVKDGTLLGLTLASPYTWAGSCALLAHKIFVEGFDATNLPASVQLDNVLITKDNVDQWVPADANQEFTTLPYPEFKPIS
jgi:ribose transport system substrate-binding protein